MLGRSRPRDGWSARSSGWCRGGGASASTVSALPPDAEMPIASVSADGGNGAAADASSTCASMPPRRAAARRPSGRRTASCPCRAAGRGARRTAVTPASGPSGRGVAVEQRGERGRLAEDVGRESGLIHAGIIRAGTASASPSRGAYSHDGRNRAAYRNSYVSFSISNAPQQRRVELEAGVGRLERLAVGGDAALLGALDPRVDVEPRALQTGRAQLGHPRDVVERADEAREVAHRARRRAAGRPSSGSARPRSRPRARRSASAGTGPSGGRRACATAAAARRARTPPGRRGCAARAPSAPRRPRPRR